jgi:rod shape-determining protein MreB
VQRGVVVDLPGAARGLDHLLGRQAGLGHYSIVILTTPSPVRRSAPQRGIAALEILDAGTVVTIDS